MKNKIFFIVFMLIWVIIVILNFIIPKKTFSQQENRNLAKLPTFSLKKLVNGEYQEELEKYINDHFIFRNTFIKINSEQERLLGKTEINDVYIGKDGYLFEKIEYTEKEEKNIRNITTIINNFSEEIDKPIYFILVPNSIYINQDKLPNNVSTYNQKEVINEFYSNLNNKINTIDVTDTLIQNKEKYLYFKTDHHITSDGAFYIYKQLKEEKGETVNLQEYNIKEVTNEFLGTFDSKTQVLNQEKDIITTYQNDNNTNLQEVIYDEEKNQSIYNEKYLEQKDKYSYFLNGNNAKVVIKTKIENEKRLLVIKDSYAHIIAQFLCSDYKEIHFIDPRYYNNSIETYIQQNNIDEILFLYNVSNLGTDIGLRNLITTWL